MLLIPQKLFIVGRKNFRLDTARPLCLDCHRLLQVKNCVKPFTRD
jgi:hypothetical protein